MNLLTSPTLPTNGTNEVQRLTLTGAPTGGTFKLRFGSSQMPGTLPYNASAAAVQTALRALPTIGSTGVTCSGGPLDSAPVDVTFGGRLGRMDVLPIQVVTPALVGGTSPAVTVSTVTPGVLGTQRSSVNGQVLLYGTDIYINHGVPYAPDWQLYSIIKQHTVTLTSGAILTLDSVAVDLMGADPASGKSAVPITAWIENIAGGTDYTTSANLCIGYANDPTVNGMIIQIPAVRLNSTTSPLYFAAQAGGQAFPAACKGQRVVLKADSAITAGTRTAKLTLMWKEA
jgi:hypothetical protein